MYGCLELHRGTLFVGGQDRTARIRAFDLDGRVVSRGFTFSDPRLGRSVAAGLAVDADHRLWVADTPAHRLRCFTLFGREIGGIGVPAATDLALLTPGEDVRGSLRSPVDVLSSEIDGALFFLIASTGERRHAVQVFDDAGEVHYSLRSLGDPHGLFGNVTGIAQEGRLIYVTERRGRVQVFRDLEFHHAFKVDGGTFQPQAITTLEDGRLLIANGGPNPALLLLDAAGRLLASVANAGAVTGMVEAPGDVVAERHVRDEQRRIVLLDGDGERIQVFTLAGRCFGAFSARA